MREGAVTTNSPGADLFSSDSSALDGYRSSAEEGATVKRFLDSSICLRRALSLYMDAKEYVRSCEGEDELCSLCAHPPPSTSLPPTDVTQVSATVQKNQSMAIVPLPPQIEKTRL